ncbi:hypothetical protein EDD85DRAFT_793992 [Armillaria nabsnona]|nr:hypothetical protein EDD85DRAFT_793992 [Armillaria nabsnona]
MTPVEVKGTGSVGECRFRSRRCGGYRAKKAVGERIWSCKRYRRRGRRFIANGLNLDAVLRGSMVMAWIVAVEGVSMAGCMLQSGSSAPAETTVIDFEAFLKTSGHRSTEKDRRLL